MQSAETIGKSGEQRRGTFFYRREGGAGRGCYKQSPLEETGSPF